MYRTTRRENGAGVTPPYCRWRRRRRADPLWPTAVSAKRRRQRRDGAHLYAELTTDTDDDKTCMCWTLTLFTRVFKPNNSTSVLVELSRSQLVLIQAFTSSRERTKRSEANHWSVLYSADDISGCHRRTDAGGDHDLLQLHRPRPYAKRTSGALGQTLAERRIVYRLRSRQLVSHHTQWRI